MIHQAFAGPGDAGGTRHYEFGRHAARAGHEFCIISSSISYHTGRPAALVPELTEGSGRLSVVQAYTLPTVHRSFAWRVASFLSFMVSSFFAALRRDTDVVYGTSPPIFQAVSAWLVAFLRGKPFVLEIRDLWPAFAVDIGLLKNPFLIRLAEGLERFLYRRADRLIVNSPAYTQHLVDRGVPRDRVSLIANGVDASMFRPESRGAAARVRLGLEGKFVVTYAGALGLANDLKTLLCAAEAVKARQDVRFLIVGDGKEREGLERLASDMRLPNVAFIGSVPKAEVPEYLAASDAFVALLRDIPMFRMTYPNKVFDYMAAGRPTVLAIDGVIRQALEEAGGGIAVSPGDSGALADAVLRLASDPREARRMGEAARAFVVERFDRADQAESLLRLLGEAAADSPRTGLYSRAGKRVLDLLLAVPITAVVLPLAALTALAVRLAFGRPVLFSQERTGLNGDKFRFIKFRTMSDARDAEGRLLPDHDRLTWLGRWLRKMSLDELPSLLHVLSGRMSLVGPRPLLPQYLSRYSPRQSRRCLVRPGITGFAQVRGRNAVTWERKLALDAWYADHLSLALDLRILLATLPSVLLSRGAETAKGGTMEEFMGDEKRCP